MLMGNDAIARGALEAGVSVVAGYPGTPSSEIVEQLSKETEARNIYVEWSVNEKVALEVAAAGSYAELKSMAVMKQVGVNVAADTLLHIAECGTRGPLVLVSCEDPGPLSSTNEGDSRPYAKMMEFPLIEPAGFQEAKEMSKWAFELSERLRIIVMLRSVTRLSHASGNVTVGALPEIDPRARVNFVGAPLDEMSGPILPLPWMLDPLRRCQHAKLKKAVDIFENSPFNTYAGPDNPELLVITSSICHLYTLEARSLLNLPDRVGVLTLGTTWPLPPKLLAKYLAHTDKVLVVEEGIPFLEDNVKALAAELVPRIGAKTFFGKKDGTLPSVNELNPDLLVKGFARIFGLSYQAVDNDYAQDLASIAVDCVPAREATFCPGCPHRASFWLLHSALGLDNRKGFICGDIGCYSLGAGPGGFHGLKLIQAMGTGSGIASGFGKLGRFGLNQPVMAVCGDSTFFHAVMPALVNAIHNQSDMILAVLDNSGTAMTGFQPHPGIAKDAAGGVLPVLSIPDICQAMGARVVITDPFDIKKAQDILMNLLEDDGGVRVVVLKQECALSPEKKSEKRYDMAVDESKCLSESCGCNRLCTRVFKCPGLIWDAENKRTDIDQVLCAGCSVCVAICPTGAITAQEVK